MLRVYTHTHRHIHTFTDTFTLKDIFAIHSYTFTHIITYRYSYLFSPIHLHTVDTPPSHTETFYHTCRHTPLLCIFTHTASRQQVSAAPHTCQAACLPGVTLATAAPGCRQRTSSCVCVCLSPTAAPSKMASYLPMVTLETNTCDPSPCPPSLLRCPLMALS